MINISEQLLDEATDQEVYLLLQIARHMNANNFCFPSNKRLMKLTGWSKNTLKKVRDNCELKNFMKVSERYRDENDKSKGQTSNGFTITTDLLSVFVNLKGKGEPERSNFDLGGGQNLVGGVGQNLVPQLSITKLKALNLYTPVINFLNEQTGSKYRASSKKTQSLINARAAEGATIEDLQKVIAHMAAKWRNDSKMASYLRPETLFGTKFEGYLNDAIRAGQKAEAHEDVELTPEIEKMYAEYLPWVAQHYPGVTATVAYLNKAQYKLLKDRNYLTGLGFIGEQMERRALILAHNRYEESHPDAVKYRSVWEYHVGRLKKVIEESTTI